MFAQPLVHGLDHSDGGKHVRVSSSEDAGPGVLPLMFGLPCVVDAEWGEGHYFARFRVDNKQSHVAVGVADASVPLTAHGGGKAWGYLTSHAGLVTSTDCRRLRAGKRWAARTARASAASTTILVIVQRTAGSKQATLSISVNDATPVVVGARLPTVVQPWCCLMRAGDGVTLLDVGNLHGKCSPTPIRRPADLASGAPACAAALCDGRGGVECIEGGSDDDFWSDASCWSNRSNREDEEAEERARAEREAHPPWSGLLTARASTESTESSAPLCYRGDARAPEPRITVS